MAGGFLTPDTQNALLEASQAGAGKSNKSLRDAKNAKAMEQAAKEFEAVFISEMMKPMFEGTQAEAPFHGGQGEEIFKSMMLSEYGKMVSQTGSIGISHEVKDMMIQMQGSDKAEAPAMNGDTLAAAESFTPEQLNAIEPGGDSSDANTDADMDALSKIINSLTTQQ